MKVALNQPILRKVLGKLMGPTESDGLIESVTEDSAVDYPITTCQASHESAKEVERQSRGQKKESQYEKVKGERSSDLVSESVSPE